MLPRQEDLLKKIVLEYVKTAEPVGSLKLSAGRGISSATIRSEMAALESKGYIYQPHISAGRVPTEDGYRFFIEKFVGEGKIDEPSRKKLAKTGQNLKGDERAKSLARAAVNVSREAVIVAFDANRLYFTGLSCLFAKPEFEEQISVTGLSQVLDHCEEVMPQALEMLLSGKRILIGRENPFSPRCGFVGAPIKEEGLFGLLGPMRMNYEKNLGIINFIVTLIR